MLAEVTAALGGLGSLAEPLGWLALGVFLAAVALDVLDSERSRPAFVAAWLAFGAFWATLIYPFLVTDESVVRGVGAALAAPLSVLVARAIYGGRDLRALSRSIPTMGVIYVPFEVSETFREQLILLVTGHTAWAMNLVGYEPPLVTELPEAEPHTPAGFDPAWLDREIGGKEYAFENTFVFFTDGGTITYTIILACTGIGSMAVIGGLVLAVRAPLRRKLRALAVALPVIYALNIVRNVFIGVSYGHQYADFVPELTMAVFALDNELRVSYIWADRIIAQTGSVIAMVVIFWLVVREVPEVMNPVEEVIHLLTGEQIDLAEALRVDRPPESGEPAD